MNADLGPGDESRIDQPTAVGPGAFAHRRPWTKRTFGDAAQFMDWNGVGQAANLGQDSICLFNKMAVDGNVANPPANIAVGAGRGRNQVGRRTEFVYSNSVIAYRQEQGKLDALLTSKGFDLRRWRSMQNDMHTIATSSSGPAREAAQKRFDKDIRRFINPIAAVEYEEVERSVVAQVLDPFGLIVKKRRRK